MTVQCWLDTAHLVQPMRHIDGHAPAPLNPDVHQAIRCSVMNLFCAACKVARLPGLFWDGVFAA